MTENNKNISYKNHYNYIILYYIILYYKYIIVP